MRVQLMLTCLCDAFFGEVGIATVRILEHAGCTVVFPEKQTCCGQPPFNAGDWAASKLVAQSCINFFDPSIAIVTPSASCAAMLRHGYPMIGLTAPRVFELSEFMLDELGVDRWPINGNRVSKKRRIAFHRACHGRMMHLGDRQERFVALAKGIEFIPFEQTDQCCGFGGAFSVGHPTVSSDIGLEKLRNVLLAGADTLVSGDMGCLMHLNGLIERERLSIRTMHYAQLMAEVLE
ncbi:MAG TPA: (Fe-S)-binding protein [Fimbriimonadaceae bacterium]|nr:(Fe-S)-binding protein [Fimbriimonadaceae bacterium]